MKLKKTDWKSPLVIIIGIFTLLFFPEPQTNFLAYSLIAIFFIIATLIIARHEKKRLQN
jgi:hypothetical protein